MTQSCSDSPVNLPGWVAAFMGVMHRRTCENAEKRVSLTQQHRSAAVFLPGVKSGLSADPGGCDSIKAYSYPDSSHGGDDLHPAAGPTHLQTADVLQDRESLWHSGSAGEKRCLDGQEDGFY